MTERKRIKMEKEKLKVVELYDKLKNIQQTSEVEEHIADDIRNLVSGIHECTSVNVVVQLVTEVLRIMAPKNFLTYSQTIIYFEQVLKMLAETRDSGDLNLGHILYKDGEVVLDLNAFIRCKIPALLKSTTLIRKYFQLFASLSGVPKSILREILVIFVKECLGSSETTSMISLIRDKDFIQRVFSYIDLDEISDDLYVLYYVDYDCARQIAQPRDIRDKLKIKYLEKAIICHGSQVSQMYLDDNDKKVKLILAKHVPLECADVVHELLSARADDIRIDVLKRIHFASLDDLDVYDRILDRSYDARKEMYRIYREGLSVLKNSEVFESAGVNCFFDAEYSAQVISGSCAADKQFSSGVIDFPSTVDLEHSAKYVSNFVNLVKKAFEGCETVHKQEYFCILDEAFFGIDFLYNQKNIKGMTEYLSRFRITSLERISDKHKAFALQYLFDGGLSDDEIRCFLESGTFECLKFIKDPTRHFEQLLKIAQSLDDLDVTEEICNLIKDLLKTNNCIMHTSTKETKEGLDESGSFMRIINEECFDSNNLYLINAHTKCSMSFIEKQHSNYNYYTLYFLIHQSRVKGMIDQRLRFALKGAILTKDQLLRLVLYTENMECVYDNAHAFLNHGFPRKTLTKLHSARKMLPSVIYFLCTGLVTIKNPIFFMHCIRAAICCSNKESIKLVFSKYLRAVEQDTYNVFYSICERLKTCGRLTNRISEKITENAEQKTEHAHGDSGLQQFYEEKMLHFLCEYICGLRRGVVVPIDVNLASFGFFECPHHIEPVFQDDL